jgi:hypothetical protein
MNTKSSHPKAKATGADLEAALATLARDYTKLEARIRELTHTITCTCSGVTLRLHFPALRQGKPTVAELVDAIALYLVNFALPRSEVEALRSQYQSLSFDEFSLKFSGLEARAKDLFIRANKVTNRNGEAGELLLYLLTEWRLAAPQLLAKMSLKTNPKMPVHGSDGVHVRYSKVDKRLLLYWGESKVQADVNAAISAAAESIAEAFTATKMKHEIELVQRNISFSGLDTEEKEALLRYLDPFEEAYNDRHDVTTCLVGFDFDGFASAASHDPGTAEVTFRELANEELAKVAPKLAKALTKAGLKAQPVELFFFPVPSVDEFRKLFQAKIGWI